MTRPQIASTFRLSFLAQYPTGTCDRAGLLVDTNASWRTVAPVLDLERCTGCLRCYLLCPEGVVFRQEAEAGLRVGIDLDFCKGCGVCAHECPVDAISMGANESSSANGGQP
jgi:2-oxoacid:acceptor oxidoreductase delta subunit (pyruvate/2-ketoisovalerate family)